MADDPSQNQNPYPRHPQQAPAPGKATFHPAGWPVIVSRVTLAFHCLGIVMGLLLMDEMEIGFFLVGGGVVGVLLSALVFTVYRFAALYEERTNPAPSGSW